MTDKQIIVNDVDVSKCNLYIDYDPPEWQGTWGGAIHKGACKWFTKDCKDNPNCLYKQLARKTEECEELKKANDEKNELLIKLGCPTTATAKRKVHILENQINVLKAEKEKMSKGYAELTDIVAPYMDDFTGYNDELDGFDIVLCVKELLEQLQRKEQECEKLKENLKDTQNKYSKLYQRYENKGRSKEYDDLKDQLQAEREKVKELEEELQFAKDSKQEWLKQYKLAHGKRVKADVENSKYKQALEYIKKMCKQKLPVGLSAQSCYESFEAFTGYVLQKISEVIE